MSELRAIISAEVRSALRGLEPPAPVPATSAEYLTSRQAAELLSTSTRSLDSWRQKGTGPRYVKLGAAIRYARADLIEWLRTAG